MIIYICTSGENQQIEAIFEDKELAILFYQEGHCENITKVYTEATPETLREILAELEERR